MIIWSGHGILIPVFGFIGLLVGSLLFGGVAGASGMNAVSAAGVGMIGGSICGAAMVWLYALTMGKTQEQTYLDPATGRPVIFRKRHTLLFIPAFAWAVIGTVGAVFFSISGAGMVIGGKMEGVGDAPGSPGAAGLREAERLISTKSGGVAHGNTAEAKLMAENFSALAKEFRNQAIEKSKGSSLSVSGGEFLTYCQVSEHGTAFIVHVPDLRKFNHEAKDAMATLAWAAAQITVAHQRPAPPKLAVAVRGVLLYDAILTGKPVTNYDEMVAKEKFDAGILRRIDGSHSQALHSFFASPTLAVSLVDSPDDDKAVASTAGPAAAGAGAAAAEPSAPVAPAPAPAAPAPASAEPPPPSPAAAPSAALTLPTPVRDWKSSDGRPLRASLVRFTDAEGASAEFKREDGVVFTIPVEKFSPEDKEEMKRIFAAGKAGSL